MRFEKENFNIQKRLAFITVFVFIIKVATWAFTHSVAVLTDALEYTINVIAGFISLYGLYLSAQPKDKNHPYGHGKAEFISAAVEGILMVISCVLIVIEAVDNFIHPHTYHKLDFGIFLVLLTAFMNYIIGVYAIKKGKKNNVLTLVATGKHMQSDTYATIGIAAGLVLLYFTGFHWIDSVVSIIFAVVIFVSGYKILRSSVSGIMDEADGELLKTVVQYLSDNRRENWMDIHNLRIIKYGSVLHLDCHLTLPWFFNIHHGHDEVKALEEMVRVNFGESVEMFVHTDGCLPESCSICTKTDCEVRQHAFVRKIHWNVANVSSDCKHTLMAEIAS